MIEVMKTLEERLRTEQALAQTLTRLLEGCPEGSIQVSTMRGHPRYYRVLGDQREYLGMKNTDLIRDLAQKDYYSSMLREASKETNALRLFLRHFDPDAHVRIYESMHNEKKRLVSPLILPDDQFAARWLEEHRAMAAARPNVFEIKNGFPTENGEMVRSKSEKILADHFLHSGVLYVYECPLQLADGTVYPDFTILNLRTRKVYYWEHCGMMDSSEYLNPMLQKIFRYERSGIFIGNQLILSMETSSVPLNMQQVDLLIRTYLL